MKPTTIGILAAAAVIVAFLIGTQLNRDPDTPVEEMGDAMEGAGEQMGDTMNDAAEQMGDAMDDAAEQVGDAVEGAAEESQ